MKVITITAFQGNSAVQVAIDPKVVDELAAKHLEFTPDLGWYLMDPAGAALLLQLPGAVVVNRVAAN